MVSIKIPYFKIQKSKRRLLFIFLLCFLVKDLSANDIFSSGSPYFSTFKDPLSFPTNTRSFTQDKQGFIWAASDEGVYRFDGYNIKYLNTNGELSDTPSGIYTRNLWTDTLGRMWIATSTIGVIVFDPQTGQYSEVNKTPNTDDTITSNNIIDFLGNGRNGVWVATRHGLYLMNNDLSVAAHYAVDASNLVSPVNYIKSLVLDNEGTLWLGTARGIKHLKVGDTHLSNVAFCAEDIFANEHINRFLQSPDGTMWVGTYNKGLVAIDKATNAQCYDVDPVVTTTKEINSLIQVPPQQLWVGMNGGGIDVVDIDTRTVTSNFQHSPKNRNGLSSNVITGFFKDASGMIWIEMFDGSISVFNPSTHRFMRTLAEYSGEVGEALSSNIVTVMESREGKIWLGTWGKGIQVIDPVTGLVEIIGQDPKSDLYVEDGRIRFIFQSSNNDIWISAPSKGLLKIDSLSKQVSSYQAGTHLISNIVPVIREGADKKLYIGTIRGLQIYNPADDSFVEAKTIKSSSNSTGYTGTIRNIAPHKNGTIFVLAVTGLYQWSEEDKLLIPVDTYQSGLGLPKAESINELTVDARDNLWLSSSANVYRVKSSLDGSLEFTSISALQDSSQSIVTENLIQDNIGRFWTPQNMFDLEDDKMITLPVLNEVNFFSATAHKTQSGALLFGSTNGLLMIDPIGYEPKKHNTPVQISKLEIDDIEIPFRPSDIMIIPPEKRGFKIEFTSLDYSGPTQVKYAYRLKGYDLDWRQTSSKNRIASYTNLNPGTYQLEVNATNSAGIWHSSPSIFELKVMPAWYQMTLVQVLFISLLLGLFYLIYIQRAARIKRGRIALEKTVEARTEHLEVLFGMASELNSSLQTDDIFSYLTTHVNKLLKADFIAIGLLNDKDNLVEFQSATLHNQPFNLEPQPLFDDTLLVTRCVRNSQSFVLSNSAQISAETQNPDELCTRLNMSSAIYLPLRTISNAKYACLLALSAKENTVTLEQINLVKTLVSYCSIALDNAIAYANAEHNRQVAEDAAKSKSEFLANLSHEIRTPMNAIINLTYLSMQTKDPEKQQTHAQNVYTASKSLLHIINDALDYSKIDAGQMELEIIPFNLAETLTNVENLTGQLAKDKGLLFKIELASDVPKELEGDPVRLNQILLNLVSNAVKFTELGSVVISISLANRPKSPLTVGQSVELLFEVNDTGIGLSEKHIKAVFAPFKQADNSTSRQYGGTGLGLSISNYLVSKMHGKIWVESKLGEGSSFKFSILSKVSNSVDTDIERHSQTLLSLKSQCQGKRILVVDDNSFNQQVAKGLLEEAGVNVTLADNGKDAVELVSKSTFDVVLMDVHMPEMDGFSATKFIRDNRQTNLQAIIALSASANLSEIQACFDSGMNDFISKPIELEAFFRTIVKWLPDNLNSVDMPIPRAGSTRRKSTNAYGADITVLRDYFGDNTERVTKYAQLFLDTVYPLVKQLELAVSSGNIQQLKLTCHKLRPTALTVGADVVADCCAELMDLAPDFEPAQVEVIFAKLHTYLQLVSEQFIREFGCSAYEL